MSGHVEEANPPWGRMAVTGIGGVFLSSPDPSALASWFDTALGITMEGEGGGAMAMLPRGDGVAVLGVHEEIKGAPRSPDGEVTAEPYGRQPMMANLAVEDLDAVIERARGAGEQVVGPNEYEGVGRFAWIRTPDGHDLELWEPAPSA